MATSVALKEKIGYALGDTASNFYWKTFEFFLLIFYTDVFGISPAVAGTMFGVTRVWDAIADPLMGALADRTRTRWGRFRPYLLWMALPLAAAGVLTFTTPDLDGGGKTVYAYATFSFLMLAYTAINIPYSALMGVMTSDSRQRTALSSLRFIGGFSGGVVVVAATPWLVAPAGRGRRPARLAADHGGVGHPGGAAVRRLFRDHPRAGRAARPAAGGLQARRGRPVPQRPVDGDVPAGPHHPDRVHPAGPDHRVLTSSTTSATRR